MSAMLEHVNVTVSDPKATADWMADVFGWHIRWQGEAIGGGHTIHIGTDRQYLAIYKPPGTVAEGSDSYVSRGGLNHVAVVVDDLDEIERKVRARGFAVGEHYDYEPGQRFYFDDPDGIEYEVVMYD